MNRITNIYNLLLLASLVALALSGTTSAQDRGVPTRGTPAGARGGPIMPGSVREQLSEAVEEAYKRMGEEVQRAVPKREYKVEMGPPAKTKLYRADPKLLENKFVATVVIDISQKKASESPDNSSLPEMRFSSDLDVLRTDLRYAWGLSSSRGDGPNLKYPEDLMRLIQWGDRLVFHPAEQTDRGPGGDRGGSSTYGGFHGGNDPSNALSEYHKLLAEHCSPPDRPNQGVIDFLTSPECDRDVRRTPGFANPGQGWNIKGGWTFSVYAPTAGEAQARVAGLIALLDGGLSRPMQRHLLAEGRKPLEAARKEYEEMAKSSATIRSEEATLSKPSEISVDILSQLKAQKVMVAVELSGLNARVRACDDMLKDPKRLEVSALQSVSDMKVKAEIERVGIKEKLDQINTFINEGDSREATRARIGSLTKQWRGVYNTARESEFLALSLSRLFDLYAPLPLKDNQITVSPVEWTN